MTTSLDASPAKTPDTITLREIALDADGYDDLGCYWGLNEPLFWAGSDCGRLDEHFRAADPAAARASLLRRYPDATFYE